MLLQELFDTAAPYEVIADTHDQFVGEFWIGDNRYHSFVEKTTRTTWIWVFCLANDLEARLGSCNTSATGTGNEFLVFSTALDILKTAIEKKNIQKLEFSAEEVSRVRMYDRLARRIPHMKLVKRQEFANDDVIYYFERM